MYPYIWWKSYPNRRQWFEYETTDGICTLLIKDFWWLSVAFHRKLSENEFSKTTFHSKMSQNENVYSVFPTKTLEESSKLCTYNFANIDMVKYVSKQECVPVGCVPGRSLTVCRSQLPGGAVCSGVDVSFRGDVYCQGGSLLPGGCMLRGGVCSWGGGMSASLRPCGW